MAHSIFIIILFFLSTLTTASLPDTHVRLTGQQGAFVNNTLWLVGGYEASVINATTRTASNYTLINLTQNFKIPDTFDTTQIPRDVNVPPVAYGALWSDESTTLWLYGGANEFDTDINNTLWRCDIESPSEGKWSEVDHVRANLTDLRRFDGSACNVASASTAFYLGGQSIHNLPQYFHSMVIFDMKQETTKVVEVPDFVPIVGQSTVYMDLGQDGILITLGGKIENNTILTPAELDKVYIYDIASNTWVTQQTTDALGRSDYFYGNYDQYGPGIPNSRWHMCAVAGAAPDATSYNIYVFGGENATNTPGDIWALSFPSAVWIRMNTTDIKNNPKKDGSCNLLHSRYVLMAGGCWDEPTQKNVCISYGWNPLLYDIALGDWTWEFDTTQEGYFVPEQIYEVIGGSYRGGAVQASPMYTEFSNSILADTFARPSDDGADSLIQAFKSTIIGLSTVFFLFGGLIVHLWLKDRRLRSERTSQPRDKQNWKPPLMSTLYLSLVLFITIFLIITVQMLSHISSLTDCDRSRWMGGIESDGTWSGQRWVSDFTPAPGSGRPIQGLVNFYRDTLTSGVWDGRDASQRMGTRIYFLWTYLPSVVSVLYGVLWSLLDGELKRVEKYYQLTRDEGAPGRSTICFEYHSFWVPLSIIQSLIFRQWAVFLSSTGTVIATIIIPNFQNYVFNWVIYSGGQLNWGGVYSWQVGYMDLYWTKLLTSFLCLDLVCLIGLMTVLLRRQSGLEGEPDIIMHWVRLVSSNNGNDTFGLIPFDSFESDETLIRSKLRNKQFQIIKTPWSSKLCVKSENDINATRYWHSSYNMPAADLRRYLLSQLVRISFFRCIVSLVEVTPRILVRYYRKARHLIFQHASTMIHPLLIITWIIWLVLSLCANLYILISMTSGNQLALSNYTLPWSQNLYLVVGVFIQSIYQVFEQNVRSIALFDSLRHGYQQADILWEDFNRAEPIIEIFRAFLKQQHLLGYVLLGTVAATIYTIMLGSLQSSAGFYGATDFEGDLASVIVTLVMNWFILIVTAAAAWTYTRPNMFSKEAILPRYPGTVASLLPWILWSENLKADINEVTRPDWSKAQQINYLKERNRRYTLGIFETDGQKTVGIERNCYSGLNKEEEHVLPYKKPWDIQEKEIIESGASSVTFQD